MRARSHTAATLAPLFVAVLAVSGPVDARRADHEPLGPGACRFERAGSTLTLRADCTTDRTIVIPNGLTLEGQNHRITARDPRGGSFRGPVVTNAGGEAHVHALVVRAVELAPRCGERSQPLAAISLNDCSGSVTDSHVEGVYRRGLACGEGTGIAVRASGLEKPSAAPVVWITGNRVHGFASAGVVVEGPLEANVHLNRVVGNGAHGTLHQQGVRMARGATGSVRWNVVSTLAHGARGALSTGLVVSDTPGPVELALNRVEQSDVGVGLVAAGGIRVEDNALREQSRAAIRVDGRSAPATDNRIRNNRVSAAPIGVLLEGALARENDVSPGLDLNLLPARVRELRGAHDNLIRPE